MRALPEGLSFKTWDRLPGGPTQASRIRWALRFRRYLLIAQTFDMPRETREQRLAIGREMRRLISEGTAFAADPANWRDDD